MKRTAIFLATIAILAAAAAFAGEGTKVSWVDADWDDVLKQAKAENKHIIIDFYTTWCGPCKRMDKVTFVDDGVAAFLNANLSVKYDCEKGFGEELADRYKVVFYPTIVVIGPDGKEIDRALGYLDPEQYMETIKGYTEGIGTVDWYEAKLAESPDDIELLHTLGVKHADALRIEKAEKALKRVLELDPDNERGWRSDIVYQLAEVNYTTDRFDQSKAYFEQLLEEFPSDTTLVDRGLTMLARVEHKMGNSDAAVATYKKYLDHHPEDPSAMNGFAWFCSQRAIGLDLALPVALKAAELSNRDPGILDTLAEVYFAMGDYDNALKIGKEALATDPEDQYFKDQVEKYEKAKSEAEEQASSS